MSSASDTVTNRPTQPFAWSVRREIWEHRAIWMAPAIAAGLVLVSFLFRIFDLPRAVREVATLPPGIQMAAISAPFFFAAVGIMVAGIVVSVFFCLSALNNERRDRSILFWKSLPVSDTTAVLAKVFVPFVVIPVVTFVAVIATQLVMQLLASAILLANGISPEIVWLRWPFFKLAVVLAYVTVITTLWYAPIYGWLLMVSSWARRVAFLWAVLPWVGLVVFESIAFSTSYVGDFINYRLNGMLQAGIFVPPQLQNMHGHFNISSNAHAHAQAGDTMKDLPAVDLMSFPDPMHFIATPGLWLGLIAAAAFIAAAIYFRRMRDPG